jgi:hypothetical protein
MAYTCKMCDTKCPGNFTTEDVEIIAYGQKSAKKNIQFCSRKCQWDCAREGDRKEFNNSIDLSNELIEQLAPIVRVEILNGEDVSEMVTVIRAHKTVNKFLKSVMTREMTNAEIMAEAFNVRGVVNTTAEKVLDGTGHEIVYDQLIQIIAMMTAVVEGCWDHWARD